MSPVGIVVAAHGDLAAEFIRTAHLIVGSEYSPATVNLDLDMNLETMQSALLAAVDEVDEGQGVLMLIDLFGGTPCNAAALCTRERDCQVVAGINLPMLLEVFMNREIAEDLATLTDIAVRAGGSGIVDVVGRLQAQRNYSSESSKEERENE